MLSHIQLCVTLQTIALQAPLSMEFSRQEYWSGLQFYSPGDLPDPGMEPMSPVSPTLVVRFFINEPTDKSFPSISVCKGKLLTLSSVQLLVVSDSLWPHEPQDTRPPCQSPTPTVHSNSCPLSRWYHPTISSSVIPFSCPKSCPESGPFQMTQPFTSVAKVLEF